MKQSTSRPYRKVRYALIALGNIAQVAVLPGFLNAERNSELRAIISGDPQKLEQLSKYYQVPHCLHYDELDEFFQKGEVDAVYIALPNHLHCDYAVRAANLGVHVLCEKPLGLNESECRRMIRAAEENDVLLMTAYRLHFEYSNLEAAHLVQSGVIGRPRFFTSTFSMQVREGIRTSAHKGGGPLYDLGVYCINAARYLFRAEPCEVFAFNSRGNDERFREVDEMVTACLRFPQGELANFICSFGAADSAQFEVIGTAGKLQLKQAYEFSEKVELELTVGEKTRRSEYPRRDQFGPEILHFSDCILSNRQPEPSGIEGLLDAQIISALQESIARGIPISLEIIQRRIRPEPGQEIYRSPRRPRPLVHSESPHQ